MEFDTCSRSVSISSRKTKWCAVSSSHFFTRWVWGCLEKSSFVFVCLLVCFVNELFSDADYIASTVWVHYQFSVLWNFARQPENYIFLWMSNTRMHPSVLHMCWRLSSIILFTDTLNDFTEVQVKMASIDALAACKKSLAHGPLLLIRWDCLFSTTQLSRKGHDVTGGKLERQWRVIAPSPVLILMWKAGWIEP